MDALWTLVSLIPMLIYGLIVYGLLVVLPRRFRARKKARIAAPDPRPGPAPATSAKDAAVRALAAGIIAAAHEPAPDSETPAEPAPPVAPAVIEPISVVLRRQVPPDAATPARSWFGGLPQMPADIPWPRSVSSEYPERGERPLHFLAQICCADLPAELWGGLGPRHGWLLVFLDPNQGVPEGNDAFRILHTPELGPERAPPPDLGPVHDGMYTGGSYRWLPKDQVPPVWWRWPVDLVPFPNLLHDERGHSVATPKGFAETLYNGAPVLPFRDLKAIRPYRVGQALTAVRSLAASMRNDPPPVASHYQLELLEAEGSLDRLRAALAAQIATAGERADSPQRTRLLERLNRMLGLVAACATPAMLLEKLEVARQQYRQWRLAIAEECDALAASLAADPPETPLSLAAWQELQARFAGRDHPVAELAIEYPTGAPKQLDLREHDEQARLDIPRGLTQQALADWLDPATRPLVPPERAADLEAAARSLEDNRPHRMGGYHDGVQSEPAERSATELLLLQIATDPGMDWCWGDTGAYYFWINPKQLADSDFSGVEMWLECY